MYEREKKGDPFWNFWSATLSSLKPSAGSKGKLMELFLHGVFFPISCFFFFSPNCSVNESQMNLWANSACIPKTQTAFARPIIPAAIPPVTNWQETHSFQTVWQLPPMRPLAVRRRSHLFPIHHNIAQPFVFICLWQNLFLIYGFLNAWKACLGSWASCLGVCCRKAAVCHLSRILLVCQQSCCRQSDPWL